VYLLLVYAPSIGVSQSTALLAGVVLNLVSMLTFSLYGRLGDRYGARRVSVIGCVYTIALAFPMFALVSTGSTILVLLAVPLCYAGSNAVFALNSSLVSMVFPTRIRYTGISVSFQVAAMISAAPAPFLATWLQSVAGGASWPVVCYLVLLATISLVCIARLRPYEATGRDCESPTPSRTGALAT
jgi:MFS family permease